MANKIIVGVLLLIAVLIGTSVKAEDNIMSMQTEEVYTLSGDYHERIEKFFSLIKENKMEAAVSFIYSDNPWVSRNPDDIQNVKNELMKLDNLVGKYQAHEKLLEKVMANRFAYLVYFVAFDRQPIQFSFKFYKPKDKWMIYSFKFESDLSKVIETQAAAELLNLTKQ